MRFRTLVGIVLGLLSLMLMPMAHAQATTSASWGAGLDAGFLRSTHLIELKQGSDLSRKVAGVQGAGFETAQGAWVSMQPWYSSRWTDSSITWMTQLHPGLGVIWGLGTGERGEKYRIDPSFKLGLLAQTELRKNAYLSFKATTVMGGRLRERACVADYGEIGGVQAVNCRLAASTLPPAETLKYLFNERPTDRLTVSMQFKVFF
jgi:hypothetical protein